MIPSIALSIRQPWAYAVAAGWKDIENRDWRKPNPGLSFRGRIAIHASSGMTRCEYEDAAGFMAKLGYQCPAAGDLMRGAIIGQAEVIDVVRQSESDWFFGRVGLVIASARLFTEPIPCSGALGFFAWRPGGAVAPRAKWMMPVQETKRQPELFD